MKKYIGTYQMTNGMIFEVYENENGKMYDANGIEIEIFELRKYKKID